MKRKQNEPPMINTGISLLVVIFIILCLVVFAVLSLASANSDYESSRTLAEHRSAYYEASNESEDILHIISENGYSAVSEKALASKLEAADIDIAVSISKGTASWTAPIDDKQDLLVEVKLNSDSYEIETWSICDTESTSIQ